MRKSFGEELVKLASKDANIFLIVGDIGFGIFDEYKEKFRNVNIFKSFGNSSL